jgi:hypothetical protein
MFSLLYYLGILPHCIANVKHLFCKKVGFFTHAGIYKKATIYLALQHFIG